jgi:hypothetical protein
MSNIPQHTTWVQLVQPLVQRCKIAFTFGQQACWDKEGSFALGKIIAEMAEKLDAAIADKPFVAKPETNTEVLALRQALRHYGWHTAVCPSAQGDDECDCGWADIIGTRRARAAIANGDRDG